jgi:ABC-type branched-subunit amino acid transport system substrate-binding protein
MRGYKRSRTGGTRVKRVLFALVILLASACSRSDEKTDAAPADDSSTSSQPAGDTGLDAGKFGDLGMICQPAPDGQKPKSSSDPGITADSIQVSTFSDPGFPGQLGLNQELFDTAEAFTKWCNEHGGLNGRKIDLKERDAKLTEFQQRVIEACDEGDFFTVGGGAAFDATGQPDRLACSLPAIVGYAVSGEAALADLSVQPVPNPPNELSVGSHEWLASQFPDSTQHVGILTANVPATQTVAARHKEAVVDDLGWKVVYDGTYNAAGETSWRPALEAMKGAGVRGLIWVGDPHFLAKVLTEAQSIDYKFDWVTADANEYDPALTDGAGTAASSTYVRSAFWPFLTDAEAKGNPATEQYRELMKRYDPNGKIAYLGVQGLSAWLLFAKAVDKCGADVTRDCVWKNASSVTKWTGGGLHASSDLTGNGGHASKCWSLVGAKSGTFALADIHPTDGPYVCAADSVKKLKGDYGTGTKCPNPDYATDPMPSNCAR